MLFRSKRFGSGASDTSKINFKGVHQTGSTPPCGSVGGPSAISGGFVLGVVPSGPPLALLPPLPFLRFRPQGIFEESPDQRASVREVRLMLPPFIEAVDQ